MSYRLLKLASDYVSGGVYTTRLELGDSGLGGPVDIRFIDEPGWIENVHSVFFSVNGTDTYPSSGGKGKITTTKYTNELVFFDELNTSGRTLSQLYEGAVGGLWQDMGTYVQLLQADSVSLRSQYITNLHDPQYSTDAATKNYVDTGFAANPLTSDLDAGGHDITELNQLFGKVESGFSWDLIFYGSNVGGSAAVEMMRWDASLQNINMAGDLYMGGHDIKGLHNIYINEAGAWDNLSFFSPGGGLIMKLWSAGDTNFAISMYGNLGMNANAIEDAHLIDANSALGVVCRSHEDVPLMFLAYYGYAFMAGANASMGGQDLISINTLKGHTETDLKFFDDVLNETKTLSQLATSGLWEVSGTAIRPKAYDIIEGRATQNLTIKAASGGILYLG